MSFNLEAFEQNAWRMLVRGSVDKKHAFNLVQIGTIGAGGTPQIRTVVLRKVDIDSRTIAFHTDIRSQKIVGMDKPIAIHTYDTRHLLQVRMQGIPILHHMDDKATQLYNQLHDGAAELYLSSVEPGKVISAPDAPIGRLDRSEGLANFCWIDVQITDMEVLQLGETHQRAHFTYGSGASKTWIKA